MRWAHLRCSYSDVPLLALVRAKREESGRSFSVTIARRELRKWLSESAEGQRVETLVGG